MGPNAQNGRTISLSSVVCGQGPAGIPPRRSKVGSLREERGRSKREERGKLYHLTFSQWEDVEKETGGFDWHEVKGKKGVA